MGNMKDRTTLSKEGGGEEDPLGAFPALTEWLYQSLLPPFFTAVYFLVLPSPLPSSSYIDPFHSLSLSPSLVLSIVVK